MRRSVIALLAAGSLIIASDVWAQSAEPDLSSFAMFGVHQDNGQLARYDFASRKLTPIGTVAIAGDPLRNVNASAYIAGHQNIIGVWNDPADGLSKLVYIDTETANTAIVGQDLGMGQATGAAATTLISQESSSSFDGVDGCEVMPHSDEYLLNNGTILFWFNARDTATMQGMFSKDSSGYDTGGHVHIYLRDGRVKVRLQGINSSHWAVSDRTFAPHEWYHVAFTFGEGGMRLYVNGDLVGGHTYAGGLGSSSGGIGNHEPIVLGASAVASGDGLANNLTDFFRGEIGHARIIGRAMKKGEIRDDLAKGADWSIFVVQKVSESDNPISFDIDGAVVPSEPCLVKVSILGASISYGAAYDIPVTTKFQIGGQTFSPFGNYEKAVSGNVNDELNPREYVFSDVFAAGSRINPIARSWQKIESYYSGKKDAHWSPYLTIDDSESARPNVLILKNGDVIPDVGSFWDQDPIADFIRDFIDPVTHTVLLDNNEAIFFFELGTTNLSDPAADFQDLVVLVTLGSDAAALLGDTGDGSAYAVEYRAEPVAQQILFDIPVQCLGEGGAIQTDRFVVQVSGGGPAVTVTTKSGTAEAVTLLEAIGSEIVDSNGFGVCLASIDGSQYTLTVTSRAAPNALSHVVFDFGGGSVVLEPQNSYAAVRNGESLVASEGPRARLLHIDHRTGGYEQLMTLNRVYEGLATRNGRTFYGSSGQELYLIDTIEQVETLIGALPGGGVMGLEFADSVLLGFEINGDHLLPIDALSGAATSPGISLGMANLGTIIYMPTESDPSKTPDSYD